MVSGSAGKSNSDIAVRSPVTAFTISIRAAVAVTPGGMGDVLLPSPIPQTQVVRLRGSTSTLVIATKA